MSRHASKPSTDVDARTYGRPTRLGESSSSLLYASSPAPYSSSPPPSSSLITPPSSPNAYRHTAKHDDQVPFAPSPSRSDKENEEVIDVAPFEPATGSKLKSNVQSTLHTFLSRPSKRALVERSTIPPTGKRPKADPTTSTKAKSAMTQMHLTHLPLLHSCKECGMSYVRGGEDDYTHSRHHAKVLRGIPWDGLGKGKGKAKSSDGGWRVIQENVTFGTGKETGTGRIIMCEASWGGQRMEEILSMVDLVLSAPKLEEAMLERCKVFLLVTSSPPPMKRVKLLPGPKAKSTSERIVGVVVAQSIKSAMRVVLASDGGAVDSGAGVMCDPEPLETPLGIHRLFTIPSYRSLGLAQKLLDASCRHTVYGCSFDPLKGEVAFSQPTDSGRRTMEKWGKGNVRVFIDDERQL